MLLLMSISSSLKMYKNSRSTRLLLGLFVTMAMSISACTSSPPQTGESPSPQSTSESTPSESTSSSAEEETESTSTQLEPEKSTPQSAESEPNATQSDSEPSGSLKSDSTKQSNQGTAEPAKVATKQLKVFFPKSPQSEQDFTYVEPVFRTTTNQGVAQFAITQLVAGPTRQEKSRGLIDPIEFKGSSNCGRDFTLSVNQGVATLKFCKQVISGGIGDDARTKSAINATLKQFSTINSVIILDKNGDCLADQSGDNNCLKSTQGSVKLTEKSKLAINGIGPVDIGMTVPQASRAAGVQLVSSSSNPNATCDSYQLQQGVKGVSFMVRNGRIARVDIDSSRITTVSGAKIGDSEARIRSLYADQLKVSRLANSETGNVLTFVPKSQRDKDLRLKFMTDGKQVTGISTGKLPEVNYIEGCLDVRPG